MTLQSGTSGTGSWPRRGGTILVGQSADALLRFGVFLATARILVPVEFSRYALLTAALATCQIVFAFGAPRTAMFLYSRGSRRSLLGWLILLAAAASLSAALGLTMLPSLRQWAFPDVPRPLVFFGLAPLPFVLLCDSLSATLLADLRERLYTGFLWARTLGGAVVLASSLLSDDRLVFLLVGRVAVNALVAAGLFAAAGALPSWRGLGNLAPEALRYGLPIAAGGAAIALHRRADVLLLSALGKTAEIGAYAVAYAVAEAFWMVTDSLEAALFADLLRRDDSSAGDQAARALRLYRIGGAGAFAVGLFAGEAVIHFLFGGRYPEAAVLFPPALLAAVVWGTIRPCTSYLYSRGLNRRVLAVHSLGAAFNIVLCLAAIPRFGARGAVAATLASYAVETALMTSSFARERRRTASAGPQAAAP